MITIPMSPINRYAAPEDIRAGLMLYFSEYFSEYPEWVSAVDVAGEPIILIKLNHYFLYWLVSKRNSAKFQTYNIISGYFILRDFADNLIPLLKDFKIYIAAQQLHRELSINPEKVKSKVNKI